MKEELKFGFLGLSSLIAIVVIGCALSLGGIYWYRFIEPKREEARREVFEETRSYNQGKIQQLAKYRMEYSTADEEGKEIIASTIKHQFADFPIDHLPTELQNFLRTTRGY
jgi:hypothetical protein